LSNLLRPAFLPDTFHEVNGVAHTARQFESFARNHHIPFLSIHPGPVTEVTTEGALTIMQLKRGVAKFGLDANLDYDPFLIRYAGRVMRQMRNFGAQLVHITGPGDMGMLGAYVSWRLQLPLVISWHTSLHEYAGRRLERLLSFLGARFSRKMGNWAERRSLQILSSFYKRAKVIMAPNNELVEMMAQMTGRPSFLMSRGVDTELFSPSRRKRTNHTFRIGYVGRLTAEKNVRFLAELGQTLITLGRTDFEFIIIGQGRESDWLRQHVPNAVLTGVLRGDRLAEAYAGMDLFAFPSATDTFGNVVVEALASGVPAVVTAEGGPRFLVQHGMTGYVAPSNWDFISACNNLMTEPALHRKMRQAARQYALGLSWYSVFERVFDAYQYCFEPLPDTAKQRPAMLTSA
jgi:glycosyltransferase involved in cell wall biosynthesis